MRFMEIANPEDQLALWKLVSDNVWSAVLAQARQEATQKAQAAAAAKVGKFQPKKPQLMPKPIPIPAPKPRPLPKPRPPAKLRPPPRPSPNKSSVPPQARSVMPSRAPPLPSAQPVLRPTHSSSFSQADLHGLQHMHQGGAPINSMQNPL